MCKVCFQAYNPRDASSAVSFFIFPGGLCLKYAVLVWLFAQTSTAKCNTTSSFLFFILSIHKAFKLIQCLCAHINHPPLWWFRLIPAKRPNRCLTHSTLCWTDVVWIPTDSVFFTTKCDFWSFRIYSQHLIMVPRVELIYSQCIIHLICVWRQGQSSGEAIISTGAMTYIGIATVSFFLLFISFLGFLMWRRRRGFSFDSKLGLANVIALEDLQDPERNCELLSSIRRSRREHQLPSSSSEQDVTDGVFLMVYLPSPYEQTLTRIARAASTSSSKDVELLPPSPGPETGSREEEEDRRLNDKAVIEEEIKDWIRQNKKRDTGRWEHIQWIPPEEIIKSSLLQKTLLYIKLDLERNKTGNKRLSSPACPAAPAPLCRSV